MQNPAVPPVLAELTEQVRAAALNHQALRIVGGASKDFYGNPTQGQVLDTRGLQGIVSYEPSELVVTARAGTSLAELEALLAAHHQFLPFEPPHFGAQATVGGMVAAGLSGPARATAGSVRDHVLGVTLINGRAETLKFGGQVIKNVAGYDVSRVMAGALGCLGLLTEVSLKVMPVPPAEATLVCELSQAQALAKVHQWGARPLPLNASCWVKDETDGGRELLFVRLAGAVAAVEAACHSMPADLPPQASCHRLDPAQAQADWQRCRDQQLPFFLQPPAADHVLWRLSVAQTTPAFDLPWPQLIEWQGAQRWLWAPLAEAPRLRQLALQAGGHATVFRARGAMVQGGCFEPLAPALERIHARLKAEFDPAGVFNPGRLSPAF